MNLIQLALPPNSARRTIVKRVKRVFLGSNLAGYSAWAHDRSDKIQLYNTCDLEKQPIISIVVPAYNTPRRYFEPLVMSVVGQIYQNWELIVVNVSTDEGASEYIEKQCMVDDRIRHVRAKNVGIAVNTNHGINKSKGEFIALLDHDDLLTHDALFEIAKVINTNPDLDVIYSDEDKITDNGEMFTEPHFKPDWSPDLLRNVNYITHLLVARKSLIEKVGMLDKEKDGSQDYDLILKLTDKTSNIVHVPKILYHWRIATNSTAQNIDNKSYIKLAGSKALKEHFDRNKLNATVVAIKNMPGFYDVRIKYNGQFTIVVLPFAEDYILEKIVLELSEVNVQAKIITPIEIKGTNSKRFKYIKNYKINEIIANSEERLVIIGTYLYGENNWCRDLISVLSDNNIHTASPLIVNQVNRIAANAFVDDGTGCAPLFAGMYKGNSTPFGFTSWVRNVDYFSARCIALRRDDFSKRFTKDIEVGADMLVEFTKLAKKYSLRNTLWSNVCVTELRNISLPKPGYFSPSLTPMQSEFEINCNEQQLIDAVISHKVINEE